MEMLTLSKESEYKKRIVENSYFAVSKLKRSENKYSIVNRETDQVLSEVSKRYALVKNIDIFEPFVKQFGYEAIHKFFNYGNRRYYYMEIKTGRKFNFGTDQNPDIVDEILAISNSYNKTKSFSFRLGAFRWICSNGLHSGETVMNYKKIHVGNIPVKKLVFEALLKYQDNTFNNWQTLKDTELSYEQKIVLIDQFKPFNETNKKGERIESNAKLNESIRYTARYLVKYNKNETDNQPNAWGLYNQINDSISRNIGGKSQIDRRVLANNRMESFLLSKV